MNGELVQLIALATHGSEWLRAPDRPPPALEGTLAFPAIAGPVSFVDERAGVTAPDTATWFQQLHDTAVDRLWLDVSGADTPWRLLATRPGGASQWWTADATVVRGLAEPVSAAPAQPPVGGATVRLRAAVGAAHDLAARHRLEPWTAVLGDALATVDSGRLLDAAGAAWVFGGMGSWSDLAFVEPDDDRAYRSISTELYDAVLEAVVAAVNAAR